MKEVSLKRAEETAIFITAFLKGGGQENIGLPAEFVLDLAHAITNKGSETLHLSGGRALEVTGFMIYGKEFNKDQRVILTGNRDKEENQC